MAATSSHQKVLGILPQEAVPGALLVFVAALAMFVVNSPWGAAYQSVLSTSFSIGPTGGGIEMKVAYWIKNALMALSVAHRAYVLETGNIVLQGSAKEMREDPQVKAAYLGLSLIHISEPTRPY